MIEGYVSLQRLLVSRLHLRAQVIYKLTLVFEVNQFLLVLLTNILVRLEIEGWKEKYIYIKCIEGRKGGGGKNQIYVMVYYTT